MGKKMPKSDTLPDKDFYTTSDLVKQSWFPVSSTVTLSKLIQKGVLHAVNVSTTKYKRYRIPRQAALDFVSSLQNVPPQVAKQRAKQDALKK